MFKFVLKRFLQAIPTIWLIVTLAFFLMRLAPGSPFSQERVCSPIVIKNLEKKYHLDGPIYKQYLRYLASVCRGDLGPSFKYTHQTVNESIAEAFPVSLKIGVCAFIVAAFWGITLGILAALNQNTWLDYFCMGMTLFGVVVPTFVKALTFILIFSLYLGWFPAGGWQGGGFSRMFLPVLTLAIAQLSNIARLTRGATLEALQASHIRTCYAKGLPMYHIVLKHMLKPVMIPVVSYLGSIFVNLITGSMVVESVFGIPGLGKLMVSGALNRDYSLVLGITILVGALTIFLNATAELLYRTLDPKVGF